MPCHRHLLRQLALSASCLILFSGSWLLGQTVMPPLIYSTNSPTCTMGSEMHNLCITLPADPTGMVDDIDIVLDTSLAPLDLIVNVTPSVQTGIGPGDSISFDVTFTGTEGFGGASFMMAFLNQADNDVLAFVDVYLGCAPVCVPPSPAVEAGGGINQAFVGQLLSLPISVAPASDNPPGSTASIDSVNVEFAVFANGSCGTFGSPTFSTNYSFNTPLPTSGMTADTTIVWSPTAAEIGCWRFTFTTSDSNGNTGTCTVLIDVVECMMFGGFSPLALTVTPDDMLLVDPVLMAPIALNSVPSLQVPNNPALVGLKVYFQTLLLNPLVFPEDPIKFSQGVEVEIGIGVTYYGPASGMNAWLDEPVIHPGDTIDLRFSIDGF